MPSLSMVSSLPTLVGDGCDPLRNLHVNLIGAGRCIERIGPILVGAGDRPVERDDRTLNAGFARVLDAVAVRVEEHGSANRSTRRASLRFCRRGGDRRERQQRGGERRRPHVLQRALQQLLRLAFQFRLQTSCDISLSFKKFSSCC